MVAVMLGIGIAAASASQTYKASLDQCPTRYTCFWDNSDYTGAFYDLYNPTDPCNGQWCIIPAKGATYENGNSAMEVWSNLLHAGRCVHPFENIPMNNTYGYFYVKYGGSDCAGIPNHN